MFYRLLLAAFLFLYTTNTTYSEVRSAIGLSGIYNFQTNGKGIGLRWEYHVTNLFSITPQIWYFPPFNTIHELYGGINLHYKVFIINKFIGYAIAGGAGNLWFNSDEFVYTKAKSSNLIYEVGFGTFYGERCFRPFTEFRYNPKWKEGSLHIGFTWYYMCNTKKGYVPCPAYNI